MTRLSTLNRRAFLTVAAALFTPGVARAELRQSTGLKGTRPTGSRLVVGGAGALGTVTTLGIFNASGEFIDAVDGEDGVFAASTTPSDRYVLLDLMLGSAHFDLDTLTVTPLDPGATAIPQLLFPQPELEGPMSSSSTHMILPTMAFDSVQLLEIESGTMTDITRYVIGEDQPLIPAAATFGPLGRLAGAWTGNNVYLLDPSDPASAVVLNGGDESMYSTGFAISYNEEWIAYTTYDPTDGRGEVMLQSTVDATILPVTTGDAWSIIQFITGDNTSFLLMHDNQIERRLIDNPTAPGERVAPQGSQPRGFPVSSTDGLTRIVSSQQRDDAPLEWLLLDLAANTGTPLPDLTGLDLLPISTWQQDPAYAVFGSRPAPGEIDPRPGPLTAVELATGTLMPLLGDFALDLFVTHSTSADGSRMLIANNSESTNPGYWSVDIARQEATQLQTDIGEIIGGSLSPDGRLGAITALNDDFESEILVFDPADPTELTSLGLGEVLTWS